MPVKSTVPPATGRIGGAADGAAHDHAAPDRGKGAGVDGADHCQRAAAGSAESPPGAGQVAARQGNIARSNGERAAVTEGKARVEGQRIPVAGARLKVLPAGIEAEPARLIVPS